VISRSTFRTRRETRQQGDIQSVTGWQYDPQFMHALCWAGQGTMTEVLRGEAHADEKGRYARLSRANRRSFIPVFNMCVEMRA
jgi:hypothetical protein